MEEKKKGNLSTVFLVIAIILIVVMGALLYMQKTNADKQIAELESNASKLQETINNLQGKIDSISNTINSSKEETNNKTEENTIKNEDVLGTYEYDVPQDVRDEYGHYYDGITIKLLENNKFEYHCGEGFVIRGVYSINKDNNIVCKAETNEGEYVEEYKVNYKYTFKYSNTTLEVISCEGLEVKSVHEETGSKYIKNN